jgi:hypothetical protein
MTDPKIPLVQPKPTRPDDSTVVIVLDDLVYRDTQTNYSDPQVKRMNEFRNIFYGGRYYQPQICIPKQIPK